jgi:hypothetical protein
MKNFFTKVENPFAFPTANPYLFVATATIWALLMVKGVVKI